MSSAPKKDEQHPRTVPAAKTLMIAVRQAQIAHERAMQEIASAAVEDNPELDGATLDAATGLWTLTEPPKAKS